MNLREQGLGRCGSGSLGQTWGRYRPREIGVVFVGTDVALGDRSGSEGAHGACGQHGPGDRQGLGVHGWYG